MCGRCWVVTGEINHVVVATQVDVGGLIVPPRPTNRSAVVQAIALEAPWYVGHGTKRRKMQTGDVGMRVWVRVRARL
jgi:hypothetical protein